MVGKENSKFMKTTDAPAAPHESKLDHCDNGCRKQPNDTYACQQKACGKDHLCEDCIWVCADCSQDFCEEHSTQLEEEVFVCGACLLKRNETPRKPIDLSRLLTDADLFGFQTDGEAA
jgi:hypothetical protein